MSESPPTSDFAFPGVPDAADMPCAAAPSPLGGIANPTILIVDDELVNCKVIAKYLAMEGYQRVVSVCQATEAIPAVYRDAPDLVLLDIMMPGIGGLEILERLRADESLRGLPVIILTASTDPTTKRQALELGATEFLTKPVDPLELLPRVKNALLVKAYCDHLEELVEQRNAELVAANEELAQTNEQLLAQVLQREVADQEVRRQRDEIRKYLDMERELSQTHKLEAVGRLAAGIAHEINTPIQYIGDNMRFLSDCWQAVHAVGNLWPQILEAGKTGAMPRELIERVRGVAEILDFDYIQEEIPNAIGQSLDGVKRVAQLVRAMKEFAHPGSRQMQDIDLNRALENTLTISRNEWKYAAELTTEFDPTLPPVRCMPGDLNQVFLNLIVNAAQAIGEASGDKGTITVTTRLDGDWAEVRIRDTGKGIPPEIQDKIFDPFFTTKQVGKGSGQGLAIARSIVVDKHGGTIDFETAPSRGTVFIVRIPVQERAVAHGGEEAEGNTPNRPLAMPPAS